MHHKPAHKHPLSLRQAKEGWVEAKLDIEDDSEWNKDETPWDTLMESGTPVQGHKTGKGAWSKKFSLDRVWDNGSP